MKKVIFYLLLISSFANAADKNENKESEVTENGEHTIKTIRYKTNLSENPSYDDLEKAFLSLKEFHTTKDAKPNEILSNAFDNLVYNILINNNNDYKLTEKLMTDFQKSFCEKYKITEENNTIKDMICIALIKEHIIVASELVMATDET